MKRQSTESWSKNECLYPDTLPREWWESFSPCPAPGKFTDFKLSDSRASEGMAAHPCSYNGYTLTKCVLSPYPRSPTSLFQSSRHSFHPGVRDSLAVDHWLNKWCENVPLPLRPMRANPSLPAGPETTTSESLQCCCLHQCVNAMLYCPSFLPQQEPFRY